MRNIALPLILCSTVALGGCVRFDSEAAAEAAPTGAAIGNAVGGPIGGLAGLAIAALMAGFAHKKSKQCKRRDNIIDAYRGEFGDIAPEALKKVVKGELVRIAQN